MSSWSSPTNPSGVERMYGLDLSALVTACDYHGASGSAHASALALGPPRHEQLRLDQMCDGTS